MTALETLAANSLTKLRTLPETFFKGQSHLEELQVAKSFTTDGGAEGGRLPDGLFRGLTSLRRLNLVDSGYKVSASAASVGPAAKRVHRL